MEHEIDVRAIRVRLNLTQAQLGGEIGVDQSTISNWEMGHNKPRGPARKLLLNLSSRPERAAAA